MLVYRLELTLSIPSPRDFFTLSPKRACPQANVSATSEIEWELTRGKNIFNKGVFIIYPFFGKGVSLEFQDSLVCVYVCCRGGGGGNMTVFSISRGPNAITSTLLFLFYFHIKQNDQKSNPRYQTYNNNTVNPLLSPPGGLVISSPFEGGLNRDRGLI